ncbi:hypothetical protein DH2020_045847 [Rehmannia glutinosa]|uniref:Uncharacterized protein n=1 Tax=Rehmannia glutinosa TaxID=99300 RepID=A0ABR0UCV5_REHGL
MSCIIWNARGLGNQRAFRELRRLIAEKDPQLLFLSETRMKAYRCSRWKEWLGYDGLFIVDCIGKKGGLMLLWKQPLVVTITSYSTGHIDSMIQDGYKNWRFTGFYGNPDASQRKYSWDLMRKLASIQELKHLPWLLGGDFNEICSHNEKMGGRRRPETQIDEFNNAIAACELREIYGSGDWFTWVNRRSGEDIIFEKLGFLSTVNDAIIIPVANMSSLEYYSSDHRALIKSLNFLLLQPHIKIVDSGGMSNLASSVQWVDELLSAFQVAQQRPYYEDSTLVAIDSRWTKPAAGYYRLDVDASYNERKDKYGSGGIIRDSNGKLVLAFGRPWDSFDNVLDGELNALLEGLRKSKEAGISPVFIYSDSLMAVQAVMATQEDLSYRGFIVQDIKQMLLELGATKISHILET